MNTIAILDLMVKDYGHIQSLLNALIKNLEKDSSKTISYFEKFEWRIEKHIFTEEKAIFTS